MPERTQILWYDTLGSAIAPRAELLGHQQADVAIVGGGYSGLWTAYYLTLLDPSLSVAIVEAEIAGHGASGRNGGWCTGGLSGHRRVCWRGPKRRAAGDGPAARDVRHGRRGRPRGREGGDRLPLPQGRIGAAGDHRGRSAIALLRHLLELVREWGFGEADYAWLDREDADARVRTSRTLAAVFTPHCAALHPARLARGLASCVERRGVRIFEGSPVRHLHPGRVETDGGALRARTVIRATEAYTDTIPHHHRKLVPIHSMMIATEPLSDALWSEIGLAGRETFGDGRRLVIYGQRTVDGRLAFGARGEYRFGSGIDDWFRPDDPRFESIRATLVDLFPALAGARITHRWGGALGVPRNWRPSLGLDPSTSVGWLGGYAGQGVAASNLAGRTLAELVVGEQTERTSLPWVGPESRRWEPEPLRWAAVRAVARAGESADRFEERTGRKPQLRGRLFDLLAGH